MNRIGDITSSATAWAGTPACHTCPPTPPGPPPPPAEIPPGPAQDFRGRWVGEATGVWWRPGDRFMLRLREHVGHPDGYGRWSDAVAAAAAASRERGCAMAICDDRGRLYVYEVLATTMFGCLRPLHVGERGELGYGFRDLTVRGIIDGDVTVTRGDCMHPWVPVPGMNQALMAGDEMMVNQPA